MTRLTFGQPTTSLKRNPRSKSSVSDSKLLRVRLIFIYTHHQFVDADKFKEAFTAAQTFNKLLKEGKTEELVIAPAIEDKEEAAEQDDADVNKTHGDDAGDDEKEE